MPEDKDKPILNVRNLRTCFDTPQGPVWAVDCVSFYVKRGRTLCLVGESGCGKTVTGLSILRLVPSPPGRIVSGEILFDGQDLLKLPIKEMRKIRGNRISMIFQEPMTSLNPVYTIGNQIEEAIRLHQKLTRKEAREKTIEMLKLVGIPSPETRVKDYPHQLSGGMRQRVMIAMALSCHPDLLIADEPTTALDVTIQAQILDLIADLRDRIGMAVILITHDLGVVAQTADDVAIMYAGRIVEQGPVEQIFRNPRHPYTIGLQKSVPVKREDYSKRTKLEAIPGMVPELTRLPTGCRYRDRCPYSVEICAMEEPKLKNVNGTKSIAACWRASEI